MDRPLDVAIVGVGCLFPKAHGRSAFWANILGGVDAIREVPPTHWNAADYQNADPKKPDHVYTTRGGFLDPVDFDALEFGVSPNNLEATDASQLLALTAVQQALNDAGYGPNGRSFDRKRTSVLLGVTGTLQLVIPLGARLGHPIWRKALRDSGVDAATAEDVVSRISDAYVPWQENSFPGLLGNVVAGRIANRFDFGGSNCVVDAACASSLAAVHLAAMELQSGRADMVVTGGVDAFNDVFMFMCFSKTPALSPTGDARPFDQSGDGTILGEGLGILLMKRRADAERDGDRIYAVLKGIGTSSDGRGNAIYAPTAKGQRECLLSAYRAASVTPDTIELVEAHGTGTKVGDGVEVSALTEVYSESGRRGTWCALGSVKSMIGHTKAAAGAAGLIKATLALYQKVLPPTIKVTDPLDPLGADSNPFYVNTLPRPWTASPDHPRRAASSSFGFGGSNFHAVLEEHTSTKTEVDWNAGVTIAAFSAPSTDELNSRSASWARSIAASDWETLCLRAAETRRTFRTSEPHRIVAVLERGPQLERTLEALQTAPNAPTVAELRETQLGIFVGIRPAPGQLAFLFPGQGSQYVGMLRDLACRFPEMLAALTDAETEIRRAEPTADRLSDVIYPPPAFDDAKKAAHEQRLRDTQWAQPALGVAAAGAYSLLSRFGVAADAFAGHSYGELVALHAAKCFDSTTLHRLSRARGNVMAARAGSGGGMLAVSAPLEDVDRFIAESRSSLVLANRNAPKQAVLSGPKQAIDLAERAFADRNIRTHRLNVAAAFHSPSVAEAASDFAAEVAKIEFASPAKPVFGNTTGRPYTSNAGECRNTLAQQLAHAVDFIGLIRQMHEQGVRTFVEVGPSNKLTGLVHSILEGLPYDAVALDASSGKRPGMVDLARTLAKIAALGHAVDLAAWDPSPPAPKPPKTKSMVSLTGANYVTARPPRPPRKLPSPTPAPSVPTRRATPPGAPPTAAPDLPSKLVVGATAAPPTRTTAPMTPPTPPTPPMPLASQDLLREGVLALQKSQQQTAELHRQFLEGQAAAQQSLLALLGVAASPTTVVPSPAQNRIAPPPQSALISAPPPTPVASMRPAAPPSVVKEPPAPQIVVPVSAPDSANRSAGRDIGALLLAVVSEKTGYPVEMLNLEMGLDADLGIDSIKRVEILSALQEKLPDVPRIAAEQLGALRTLQDVVNVLEPGVVAPAQPSIPPISTAAAAQPSSDRTAKVLLSVVAEKTGYPIEMLGLEMGLDADLGIDSIKRVEILSAVQEQLPGARSIAADQLGALRTLADVAAALTPVDSPFAPSAPASSVAPVDLAPIVGNLGELLLKVVADKTGYPIEMLNLDMGLDSDLGIDSIKRVEILSSLQEAAPGLPRLDGEQLGGLRTLGDVVAAFGSPTRSKPLANGAPKPAAAPPIAAHSNAAEKATPDRFVRALDLYAPRCSPLQREHRPRVPFGNAELWVVGAPHERRDQLVDAFRRRDLRAVGLTYSEAVARATTDLGGLIFAPTDQHPLDQSGEALAALQHAAASLQSAALKGRGLLGVLVGFDGRFGLESKGDSLGEPRQAACIGLAKTARFEWPGLICKVIDADSAADADDVAEEFLTIGPLEVGLTGSQPCHVSLQKIEVKAGAGETPPIEPRALVVVTGGGRGVTAKVTEVLATEFRPTLALLGRSPLDEEPNWLHAATSEAEIKRLLLAHADGRPSPKELNRQCAAVLGQREVRATLAAVERTGGRAVYRNVDVRNNAQVTKVVSSLRAEFGPVRGVIHGAGVLADKLIVDKSSADYENVYATKVDGLENVLAAIGADDLRLLVLFSSSTARFGRKGQSDYAAANEVLNKLAQRERRRRPNCRVVSFNWGPWDGGMVDQSLKAVFAQEGIEVIPRAAGAQLVAIAAQSPLDAAEIVVLGRGSRTPEGDAASTPATEPSSLGGPPIFEHTVELSTHPVLRSHVIKEKAVVPTVLMVEWAAHAALLRNPGLAVVGAEDFSILAGVKLSESDSVHLNVFAGKGRRDGGVFRVPVEIRGVRNGKQTSHARGTILVADRLPAASEGPSVALVAGESIAPQWAYDELLFHGPALHALTEIEIADDRASASVTGSPDPTAWFDRPVRSRWLTAPLAVDAAFQLAVVWCRRKQGAPCLPTRINRLLLTGDFSGPLAVRARFSMSSEHVCHGDFEFVGPQETVVARLSNCEFVVDPSLSEAFRRRECSAGS